MNLKLVSEKYQSLLILFIILQPVIDILTSLSVLYIDFNITIGIVIRMLFMAVSLLYIFFANDSPFKKYIITYLILLFVVLGIGFLSSIIYKPIFNLFLEAQWIAKILYYVVMFCSFLIVFSDTKKYQESKLKVLKAIFIAMNIVTITILLSIVTGTSTDTYEWVKDGFKGWFYSGNEIGAIIAITFPFVTLYSLKKTNSLKDIKYWIPTILLAIVGVLLGTKVGLFAIIGSLIVIFFTVLISWLSKTKNESIRSKFIFTALTVAIFVIASPFTPSVKNLSVDMPIPEKDNIISGLHGKQDGDGIDEWNSELKQEENTEEELAKLPAFLDSPLVNKILSSRHFYFTRQYNQYVDANIVQKLFGMGYAGNYTDTRKTIEMDFLDIFFSFGIFGSLLIFLPTFVLIGLVLKQLFSRIKSLFTPENILLITSILLGNGIALIAGHVWFAPAVNIYLALAMVLLYYNLNNYKEEI